MVFFVCFHCPTTLRNRLHPSHLGIAAGNVCPKLALADPSSLPLHQHLAESSFRCLFFAENHGRSWDFLEIFITKKWFATKIIVGCWASPCFLAKIGTIFGGLQSVSRGTDFAWRQLIVGSDGPNISSRSTVLLVRADARMVSGSVPLTILWHPGNNLRFHWPWCHPTKIDRERERCHDVSICVLLLMMSHILFHKLKVTFFLLEFVPEKTGVPKLVTLG